MLSAASRLAASIGGTCVQLAERNQAGRLREALASVPTRRIIPLPEAPPPWSGILARAVLAGNDIFILDPEGAGPNDCHAKTYTLYGCWGLSVTPGKYFIKCRNAVIICQYFRGKAATG